MGVYIKGMKMQTSCYDCPCNKDDGFGFFTCGVTKSDCDFISLPSDCPLVPVPPHGDLIDRDALAVHKFVTEHDKYRQNDIPNMDGGACYRRGWDDAVDAIMVNASTVIPASEEGET